MSGTFGPVGSRRPALSAAAVDRDVGATMVTMSGVSAPVRVFVVDDYELVRRGLRGLLEAEGDLSVVGEAGSVREAFRGIETTQPDVVLVDARLPDGHGTEVCRGVVAAQGTAACVMITAFGDEGELLAAAEAGAAAFVLKEVVGLDLVATVRRVASGESLIDGATRDRARASSSVDDRPALWRLTPREREVLDLLAEGLSNRHVAERLGLSEKTVKNHVTGVLAKLGLDRRAQAAALMTRHRR